MIFPNTDPKNSFTFRSELHLLKLVLLQFRQDELVELEFLVYRLSVSGSLTLPTH